MRVISGVAKGIRLETIEGNKTRPTTDRVKEAMFNLIQLYVKDSKVLDLFAGSGSIGVECASRGSQDVVVVENNTRCIQVINENYKKTKLDHKMKLIKGDYEMVLARLPESETFDLILMDPPYDKGFEAKAVELILEKGLLAPDGIIVIEHSKDTKIDDGYLGMSLMKQKKYGSIMVSVLEEA